MQTAIACEKAIKEWKRASKIKLIEEVNPVGATYTEILYERELRWSFRRKPESIRRST